MNKVIESIFKDFTVNGVEIPVSFLKYTGEKETYVTYQEVFADTTYSGDDELLAYVDYYDFDIYSKGNYFEIVSSIKEKLKQNGFEWQPSNSSADMYESDTGYFHKTLNFSYLRGNN